MANPLPVTSNILDHKDGVSDRQAAAAFGARIRERANELEKSSSDIGRLTGIKKQSMTGYWNGDRLCGSDKLFVLADALRVRARWLISGQGPKLLDNPLTDVADTDFVGLPRYDLTQRTETGKGPPIETIPFRRDWLNRSVGTHKGLWITELASSYKELGLLEGDAVICSDIGRDETPPDNITGFFLGEEGGLFVARYRNSWTYDANATPGPRVGPADIVEHRVQPIARIRAQLISNM